MNTYLIKLCRQHILTFTSELLQDLKATLDGGHDLPFPDGILINGRGSNGYTFTVDQGNEGAKF